MILSRRKLPGCGCTSHNRAHVERRCVAGRSACARWRTSETSPESTSDCAVSIIAGIESNQPYPRTTVRFEASPSSRRVNIARCGKKLASCSAFVTRNTIYAEQERHLPEVSHVYRIYASRLLSNTAMAVVASKLPVNLYSESAKESTLPLRPNCL